MKTLHGLTTKNISLEDLHTIIIDTVQDICEKTLREISAVKIFRHVIEPSFRTQVDEEQPVHSLIYVEDDITYSFDELLEKFIYVQVYLMVNNNDYLIVVESNNERFYQALKDIPIFEEETYDPTDPNWRNLVEKIDDKFIFKAPIVCSIDHTTMSDFEPEFTDDEINEYLIEEDKQGAVEYYITKQLLHDPELNMIKPESIIEVVQEYVKNIELPETPIIHFTDKISSIEPLHIPYENIESIKTFLKEQ